MTSVSQVNLSVSEDNETIKLKVIARKVYPNPEQLPVNKQIFVRAGIKPATRNAELDRSATATNVSSFQVFYE